MNIKKIVVDELPSHCEDCGIFNDLTNECSFLEMYVSDSHKRRHEMCPLETEEVCEWVYSRDNHPNITYKSTHKIDLYIPIHTKDTINYCPSCGKRIKYVEVK